MNPTAVYLHSTGTLPSMWASAPRPSGLGLQAVMPANLGYPPLSRVDRPAKTTVDGDIKHVLTQIPPSGPLHLVGHSYGGLMALKMLPLLGERIVSLYLYEPVMFGALARSSTAGAAAVDEAKRFTHHEWFLDDETRGGTEEWLSLFVDFWNKPGSWQRMPTEPKAFATSVGWKMFQEVRSAFYDTKSFDEFATNVPLTLVKGARSPESSRAMVDGLAQANPHALVQNLEGTGHMAPLTHPSLFADSLRAHWGRLGL